MSKIARIGGTATQASEGWLKPMFPIAGRAHYFEKEFELPALDGLGVAVSWHSLCGIDAVSTGKMPMFDAGNWVRCKRCEQQMEARDAA